MSEPSGEGEWERMPFAALRANPQVIFIDNIRESLASGSLASKITADEVVGRVVRSSDAGLNAVNCVWVGTANNPSLSSEMARRVVRIQLDARVERPELRTFREPRLKETVCAVRLVLVWSALVMIRHWLVNGSPRGSRTLGMFES